MLDFVAGRIGPGVSTEQIDEWVYEQTVSRGAVPATPITRAFQRASAPPSMSRCVTASPSPNVVLQEGDIVNVDVSTVYHGYFSDSSRMFCVGQVGKEKRRLVGNSTKSDCRRAEPGKTWGRLGDVGQATHDIAREENGYTIVREIGGHGIGLEFHEEPWVSYVSKRSTGMLLAPGMVFTIEPMVNMGRDDILIDEEDGGDHRGRTALCAMAKFRCWLRKPDMKCWHIKRRGAAVVFRSSPFFNRLFCPTNENSGSKQYKDIFAIEAQRRKQPFLQQIFQLFFVKIRDSTQLL